MRTLSGWFHHTQRGVTIIELLVALAVFALFILMIDAVFSSVRTNARKTEVAAEVQQNARIATYRITRELRETNINQIVYNNSVPGQSQLVLKSARLGTDNTVFCLYTRTNSGLGYNSACFFGSLTSAQPPYTGTPPSPCNTTDIPCATYTPLWQQYVGYYVQGPVGGPYLLYRVVGNLSPLPNQALSTSMLTGGDVIASSIQSFDIAVSGGIVSVTIQGQGTEKVQGQALPIQQIALPSQSMTRN